MKQYLDLLRAIQKDGSYKPAARANMPGTQSLFGYQFRHDLGEGFPALTTKKLYWKGVVVELLWFLRGDTNIKYLVDNGVNIWNEDAYNYYKKVSASQGVTEMPYDWFIDVIKEQDQTSVLENYTFGDCGNQYGKVWRNWSVESEDDHRTEIDQISNVINSLKNSPESRRHIVTAIDPVHDIDLALYPCHAMFQFNCRELNLSERLAIYDKIPRDQKASLSSDKFGGSDEERHEDLDDQNIPKYYLDCQLFQRSADVVLGVPFNIASYALLTHIVAKICNMIPGEFIHTFGDVHIYDNHVDAVKEQLSRQYTQLPTLNIFPKSFNQFNSGQFTLDEFINDLCPDDFNLVDYNPQSAISAKLSTGLK